MNTKEKTLKILIYLQIHAFTSKLIKILTRLSVLMGIYW